MWSSAINTRNNVTTDAGAGFEQTLTGLTLGIDSRFSREETSTIRGLFFGYSHSEFPTRLAIQLTKLAFHRRNTRATHTQLIQAQPKQ